MSPLAIIRTEQPGSLFSFILVVIRPHTKNCIAP